MSRAVLFLRSDADRNRAALWCRNAPDGCRIEFRGAKRSTEQNDRMWAMLTDIATQVEWDGKKRSTDEWKTLFMDALNREARLVPALDGVGVVNLGRSSSKLTKAEMSDLIELMFAFGAERGVEFHEPSAA